jgi:hypothetical protein
MPSLLYLLCAFFLFLFAAPLDALARDVHVNGYYRNNGTYVRPHVRSSPDGDRSNNYGRSEYYGQPPSQRDHDRDGIANKYDRDDDNDGTPDNSDPSQYGGSR